MDEIYKREKVPRLAWCAAATFLLFWAGCTARSNKGAATTNSRAASKPVRLSASDADAAEPAIAWHEGGAVAVWVEHHGAAADVMAARLDRAGQLQGAPVRVNPRAGEATAWRGDPPTAAFAPDGALYVGWTARVESESGHADDLYLSVSRDGGRTFNSPVKVNDDNRPAVHGMHSLATGANGRIYLAWLDERNVSTAVLKPAAKQEGVHQMESARELFTTYSTDGGRTFAPNRRIATDVCPCCKTSLAGAPDGRVYVSWRQVLPGDFRHIAVASSSDGGETFSPFVIVSDDRWQIGGCPVSGAALDVDRSGTLRVLWYTAGAAGAPGLYLSQSHDNGRTFEPRRLIAATPVRGTPAIVNKDGSLNAVWQDDSGGKPRIAAARLDDSSKTEAPMVSLGDGELPAAVAGEGVILIAYVAKADEHRSVLVERADTVKLKEASKRTDDAAASSPTSGVTVATYRDINGRVEAVNRESGVIRINHEEIAGYMAPMTMDYRVRDRSLLERISPGDAVAFTLENRSGVTTVGECRH